MEEITLNNDQIKAFKSLERAYKKCVKANIEFYTVQDSVMALDGNRIKEVTNDTTPYPVDEFADTNYCITDTGLSGFADDRHYLVLKSS